MKFEELYKSTKSETTTFYVLSTKINETTFEYLVGFEGSGANIHVVTDLDPFAENVIKCDERWRLDTLLELLSGTDKNCLLADFNVSLVNKKVTTACVVLSQEKNI